MQITIVATLTEEQSLMLAKEKGYSEIITIFSDPFDLSSGIEEPNPEIAGEFLKRIYESLCVNDITNSFLQISNRKKQEEQIRIENEIKQIVSTSITSYVE